MRFNKIDEKFTKT
jgi:hypothetical protein